jgi:hypothetical protein
MGVANEGHLLIYRREFAFDHVRFGREQYDALRESFGVLHERDEHTLAVKRVEAGSE